MFLQLFNKTPEQYRTLLDFLESEQNIVLQGFKIESPAEEKKFEARFNKIAYISSVRLHEEQKEEQEKGNLDVAIGIPVLYRNPDGKWQRVSKKIIDDILNLLDIFEAY